MFGFGKKRSSGVRLAGVEMTRDDETRHVMLIGDDDDARRAVVRNLLLAALGRGDSVIVADPGGSSRSALFDPRRGDTAFVMQAPPRQELADAVRAGRGAVFLEYKINTVDYYRNIIQEWIDLAMRETMRVRADGRPVWFVIEEVDMIGPLKGLAYSLGGFSRCGTRSVLGLSSLSRMVSRHGEAETYAVLNQCANAVVFKCSGFQPGGTAHFAARLAGNTGSTYSDGSPVPVLMPEEIDQLPRGSAYLKLASKSGFQRVRVA
jgi:hypothetical protein